MKYYIGTPLQTSLLYRVNTQNCTVSCFGGAGVWLDSSIDSSFIPMWLTEIPVSQVKTMWPNAI